MLANKIQEDMIAAMKAHDALRVSVLRMLISELNYKKIDLQRELTDADVAGVVAKEVKKRNEAVESFKAGGRTEQAASEAKEAEILKAYMPEMMNEADLRVEIEKEIAKLDEAAKGNFGQAMKIISPMFRGKADGGMVANIVKELL